MKIEKINFNNNEEIIKAFTFLTLNESVSPLVVKFKSQIESLSKLDLCNIIKDVAVLTNKYNSGMYFAKYNSEIMGIVGCFISTEKNNKIQEATLNVFLKPTFTGKAFGKNATLEFLRKLKSNKDEFSNDATFLYQYIDGNEASKGIQRTIGLNKISEQISAESVNDKTLITMKGKMDDFFIIIESLLKSQDEYPKF